MTTPNSPEAVADSANGSATYGTRSRGRNAPRPNYAEDRDVDMVDASTPKSAKRNSGVALNSIVNGAHPEEKTAAPRKSLNGNANGLNGAAKESIPGTSSFSARPEDVNGSNLRKRKQPASTPNSTPSGNSAKKLFTSPPRDSEGDYFTNMMSFETHGPYLKDGELIADDGTTLRINGELPPNLPTKSEN